MNTATLTSPKIATRAISNTTRGRSMGPITRLMSPSDLGQHLKPFVFLDLFDMHGTAPSFGLHPHSGIATITLITHGHASFDDPVSGKGIIAYGGVEWLRAGGGVWHGTEMVPKSQHTRGFQLWVALLPELENTPSESQFIEATHMPTVGPVRVILGSYAGAQSPVQSPAGMTYLLVTLKAGERWHYAPPPEHDVAWLAVSTGTLHAGVTLQAGELAAFEPGSDAIYLQAGMEGDVVFVLGSAAPHRHDLVLGRHSVHTSPEALRAGEAGIATIGARLRASGVNV
jgi:redox-sensitive bicupin YhaK (pirin superfamily)